MLLRLNGYSALGWSLSGSLLSFAFIPFILKRTSLVTTDPHLVSDWNADVFPPTYVREQVCPAANYIFIVRAYLSYIIACWVHQRRWTHLLTFSSHEMFGWRKLRGKRGQRRDKEVDMLAKFWGDFFVYIFFLCNFAGRTSKKEKIHPCAWYTFCFFVYCKIGYKPYTFNILTRYAMDSMNVFADSHWAVFSLLLGGVKGRS